MNLLCVKGHSALKKAPMAGQNLYSFKSNNLALVWAAV
jgi:hypothetical protein